jgi:hypothetical protein
LSPDEARRGDATGDAAAETSEQRRQFEQATAEFQPKVLARFNSESGPPFLVERRIGRGKVIFASSGVLSSWNTLPKTNAIVIASYAR